MSEDNPGSGDYISPNNIVVFYTPVDSLNLEAFVRWCMKRDIVIDLADWWYMDHDNWEKVA